MFNDFLPAKLGKPNIRLYQNILPPVDETCWWRDWFVQWNLTYMEHTIRGSI